MLAIFPINTHKSALLSTINAFLFENIWYKRKICNSRHFYMLRIYLNLWTFFKPQNWLAGKKQHFPCLFRGLTFYSDTKILNKIFVATSNFLILTYFLERKICLDLIFLTKNWFWPITFLEPSLFFLSFTHDDFRPVLFQDKMFFIWNFISKLHLNSKHAEQNNLVWEFPKYPKNLFFLGGGWNYSP